MKKLIAVLILAISFVAMILISYMKFQTTLYFDHLPTISGSQGEYQNPIYAENEW